MRSGDRHEKDDRSRVDDPRSWVLGWINERKIAALTEHMVELQAPVRPGRCARYRQPSWMSAAQA